MSDPQYEVKIWLREKLEPRGMKTKLAEATGLSPDKITRSIEIDDPDPKKRRTIKLDEFKAMARFFGELPPGFSGMTYWLDNPANSNSEPVTPGAKRTAPNASFPPVYQKFPGDSYVPVRGQTAGGPNGRFVLNGAEVGRVFTPPDLDGVEGAYAVRVFGTSMHPRFKPGETVWINPHLPVRQGDDCVVQMKTDEVDGRESYIKEFVSRSSSVLRLWQHNPDEGEKNEIELDAKDVLAVHKVVFQAML